MIRRGTKEIQKLLQQKAKKIHSILKEVSYIIKMLWSFANEIQHTTHFDNGITQELVNKSQSNWRMSKYHTQTDVRET